jgi:hypothetical protein
MVHLLRSLLAAVFVAASVYAFTIGVLGPLLPRSIGAPDLEVVLRDTLPAAERIHVTGANGAVRIRTHDKPEIQVEATVRAYLQGGGQVAEARQALEEIVSTESIGGTARIAVIPPDSPPLLSVETMLALTIPAGAAIEVENRNGNVWIGAGCGRLTVHGGNADIEVFGPDDDVFIETTNGRIRVFDASKQTILHTVNGNVYAHVAGGTLNAETVNGTVVARLLSPDVDACRISTGNGGVVLNVPQAFSARIIAETARGRIRSDIPMGKETSTSATTLDATVGAGEAYIDLATLNGNILIQYGNNP